MKSYLWILKGKNHYKPMDMTVVSSLTLKEATGYVSTLEAYGSQHVYWENDSFGH